MWLRLAAIAVLSLVPCLQARAQAMPDSPLILTLDDAFARVAKAHPDLRLLRPRQQVLLAEREQALLRPAWTVGAQLENVLGSGQASGLQGAELTVSLATVFERGGKLDARRVLAERRLDLLADTARRHLAMAGARSQRDIADRDIAQRKRTVAGARQRLQAGASPESVVLTAQAALARAELDRARAVERYAAARQHLAALWGERAPTFDVAAGDPLQLADIGDAEALSALLGRTPELQQFASEQRIREARLQLARSDVRGDIDWSFGVRRLQAGGDVGLVASIAMPLGARSRAQPAIHAAEAEIASLEIERESRDIALYSTLVEAHGRYRVAQLEVARLREDVLPKLAKAETAAERAYRAGAISYLEWAQLQSERTAAYRQQLDVALDAQRALIELQRLTGDAIVTGATQRKDLQP